MPVARLPKLSDRTSGVLLHPTSLPGGHEGGQLGAEARAFVDFLAAAGQSWWQMLPVGPTGYGNSPYSAQSAFAGNPALVARRPAGRRRPAAAAPIAASRREDALRAAFAAFRHGGGARPRLRGVRDRGAGLARRLRALPRHQARARRGAVDALAGAAARSRPARARRGARERSRDEIAFVRFVQWRFARDWRALRDYAHARGVGAHRRHPDLRRPRQRRRLAARASSFTSTTRASRRWSPACRPTTSARPASAGATRSTAGTGCARTGYAWWIERFRATLARFDAVRLDHFIGFARYWEIPARRADRDQRPLAARARARASSRRCGARCGDACRSSPRTSGVVTPEVKALRDALRAARASRSCSSRSAPIRSAPDFLPHNYPRNAVVYTGTHDNDTTVGLVPRSGQRRRAAPEQTETERRAALALPRARPDDGRREIHWQHDPDDPDVGRQRRDRPGAGPARASAPRRA